MRPRIGGKQLDVAGKALLQFNIQRVVGRVSVRHLRVHIGIRIERAGSADRSGQLRVKDRLADRAAGYRCDKEIVRADTAEIIGRDRADESLAGRIIYRDQTRDHYREQSITGGRHREERGGRKVSRETGRRVRRGRGAARKSRVVDREAAEVFQQLGGLDDIHILRVRQVTRLHGDKARRERHVFAYLAFKGKIALPGVRVLEILDHVKREGQDRAESRERARIKALEAEQVLRR